MGVWYGDEYYTFPECVEYAGLTFRFDRLSMGEPEYVCRGRNIALRTKNFREFIVETLEKKKIVEIRDIKRFHELDEFFGVAKIAITSFNSYVVLYFDGSEYFVRVSPGGCSAVIKSRKGLVRVRFDFVELPEVFREPEKYAGEVVLGVPGELIKRVWGKADETVVYFGNGAYVTVTDDGKITFFRRIDGDTAKRIAMSDEFVVLSGLIEEKEIDIRTSYDGDYVGLVKRLVEAGKRRNVVGPLVRVDGRQVVTPRGFVTLAGEEVVVDDEIIRAVEYVFGGNDDFNGRVGVILNEEYSKIVLQGGKSGTTIYRVGGQVFWDFDYGEYMNGKYVISRGINVGKNVVPLNVPVKRSVIEKIGSRKDVYPGDVFPGMSNDAEISEMGRFVSIVTKKKTAVSRIEFDVDGVFYSGLPYVTGVAALKVPWDYDGDVLNAPVPCEEFVVRYMTLHVVNGILEYESATMLSGGVVIVRYGWGHIFICDRYVEVEYRGYKKRFDHAVIFDDEEQLFVLLSLG